MWQYRNLFYTLWVGMKNRAATVENSLAVPQKVKKSLSCDLAIHFLSVSKRDENDHQL